MSARARAHPLWMAYVLHRVSGLALALFLPAHFWLLSLAVREAAQMDQLLALTDLPLVKFAEFGLVFLLAVHAGGGMRLMALERLHWPDRQKTLAAWAVGVALLISGAFLLRAI